MGEEGFMRKVVYSYGKPIGKGYRKGGKGAADQKDEFYS